MVFPSADNCSAGTLAFSASLSSESSLEAKVACPHPSHSARYCPVCPWSSSMDCLPRMQRSGFSLSTTFCRSPAAPIGSSGPGWFTHTARAAPIANAWRSCSCTSLAPMDTTTTSPPCFAVRRRPSSTAISSKGFILYLRPSWTIPEPSAFTLILDSGSSTRFAVTRIFMGLASSSCVTRCAADEGCFTRQPRPNQPFLKRARCSAARPPRPQPRNVVKPPLRLLGVEFPQLGRPNVIARPPARKLVCRQPRLRWGQLHRQPHCRTVPVIGGDQLDRTGECWRGQRQFASEVPVGDASARDDGGADTNAGGPRGVGHFARKAEGTDGGPARLVRLLLEAGRQQVGSHLHDA